MSVMYTCTIGTMTSLLRVLQGFTGVSVLVTALACAAAAPDDISGRYLAVTETEWALELDLQPDGTALVTSTVWLAGERASTEEVTQTPARWQRSGALLNVTYLDTAPHVVVYELQPCLSYAAFGGNGCSPGLQPAARNDELQYRLPLWRAGEFLPAQQDAIATLLRTDMALLDPTLSAQPLDEWLSQTVAVANAWCRLDHQHQPLAE